MALPIYEIASYINSIQNAPIQVKNPAIQSTLKTVVKIKTLITDA